MAEIKMRPAIYANHRRKDGSYPVKIVIYFKGKERKLSTHIVAEAKEVTRTVHLKQGEALSAAQDLIIDMRSACRDIPYFDLEYQDIDFVVNYIKGKRAKMNFRLDFLAFGKEWIADKKEGTRLQYQQALNAFARYLKVDTIDINAITRSMVEAFIEFLDKEPKVYRCSASRTVIESKKEKAKGGQASRHVVKLAAIHKAARKRYNDEDSNAIMIPRSPFEGHELTPPPAQGQKPLPIEVIQALISTKTENAAIRTGIDVAIVSLGLMGINLADLYEIKPPAGDTLIYYRKKTRDKRADKAEMRIEIPECIRPFIERLKSQRNSQYWLGRLHEVCRKSCRITPTVNYGLQKWCEERGIERFTFYALRKSWGTIARRIGVEKSLVDEGLAHVGDYRMTDIYAERPWDKINEANSSVLALFNWD
jgi:integrase